MKTYKLNIVHKTILGDLHTPVGTYLKVRDMFLESVLMESSDYHGGDNGRSFIGLKPMARVAVGHNIATLSYPDHTVVEKQINRQYTVDQAINEFISSFKVEGDYSQYAGMFGYTSFNAVKYFENIDVKDSTADMNDAPDLLYIMYKYLIVFNDYKSEMVLLELVEEGEEPNLEFLEKAIQTRSYSAYEFKGIGEASSTLSDDEHRENIRRGIQHCKRGDVFQIVLSRRFSQQFEGDDFKLYRALRSINPSPYLFYFDFGGFHIFGSSPETHCRIEDRKMFIDPIAGTTKRSGNKEQDKILADELQHNPKETAEHVMLVDLARNDLSRNCHNVKLDFYKESQFYSHVIHLVSRVSGDLDEGKNPVKAFIDTFPAGTLSGAPKVRAMQLISEYEPHNRGAYGGCIGFIGLEGNLNQAITIRTFISRNNTLWFQAGGGIVAKSNVEYELQEVNNKLGALKTAIRMAEKM